MKTIKIDVISDFLCPWCYIGHLDLERGLARAREADLPVQFNIQYHPYLLNPSLPSDQPKSQKEFYEGKLGKERFEKMKELVHRRGQEEGINFKFDGVVRQTVLAHRLLTKSFAVGGQNVQLVLLKAIFRALFEEGQDIGDVSTLAKLAVANKVFTSESEARVWLEGKELEDSVLAMSTHASTKLGITGVPFTVINDKWALNGCISTECFSKVFGKIAGSDTPQFSAPPTPVVAPAPPPAPAAATV